jgi:hypothetical protein
LREQNCPYLDKADELYGKQLEVSEAGQETKAEISDGGFVQAVGSIIRLAFYLKDSLLVPLIITTSNTSNFES